MKSRRQFIKVACTGILAAGVTGVYGTESTYICAESSGDNIHAWDGRLYFQRIQY